MKVIVAGSRIIDDKKLVWDAIERSKFNITTLISGGAMGVDTLAEGWAKAHNIPILQYKPHYSIYNPKEAPLLRNQDMARDGDALIAIRKNKTTGTAHMIGCMRKQNKPVEIIEV